MDKAAFAAWREKFEAALADDFNTSMALTVLYDMLKADVNDATKFALAESFDEVLSLNLTVALPSEEVDAELAAYVEGKIAERAQAKKEKDFAKADAIRNELLEKGIVLKDTREGTQWSRA